MAPGGGDAIPIPRQAASISRDDGRILGFRAPGALGARGGAARPTLFPLYEALQIRRFYDGARSLRGRAPRGSRIMRPPTPPSRTAGPMWYFLYVGRILFARLAGRPMGEVAYVAPEVLLAARRGVAMRAYRFRRSGVDTSILWEAPRHVGPTNRGILFMRNQTGSRSSSSSRIAPNRVSGGLARGARNPHILTRAMRCIGPDRWGIWNRLVWRCIAEALFADLVSPSRIRALEGNGRRPE